jgi:hypothetical protein
LGSTEDKNLIHTRWSREGFQRSYLKRILNYVSARGWWLMPVILASWEAEIRRIKV